MLADLMEAREDKSKRPSVETSLHDLFRKHMVHTHPALINALHALPAAKGCKEIFGDDMIWIAPTMPGYVLASEVKTKIGISKTGKRQIGFSCKSRRFIAGIPCRDNRYDRGVYDAVKSRIKISRYVAAILNPSRIK